MSRPGLTWISFEEGERGDFLRATLDRWDVILDLGVGIRPQQYVEAAVHICVDAYGPYLERLRGDLGDDPRFVLLHAGWQDAMAMLLPASIDVVFALDVIEHLEKADGARLLAEAERVARRHIVVFTPIGFYPQSYANPAVERDRWGMYGGFWQTHRSGWSLEDFQPDWKLFACADFHKEDQHGRPLSTPFGALWAIRTLEANPRR
jgi:hypothetical protein